MTSDEIKGCIHDLKLILNDANDLKSFVMDKFATRSQIQRGVDGLVQGLDLLGRKLEIVERTINE